MTKEKLRKYRAKRKLQGLCASSGCPQKVETLFCKIHAVGRRRVINKHNLRLKIKTLSHYGKNKSCYAAGKVVKYQM